MDTYNLMALKVILYDDNNIPKSQETEVKIYTQKLIERINRDIANFCISNPVDNYYLMLFILKYKKEVVKDFSEQYILELLKYGKVNQIKPYEAIVSSNLNLSTLAKQEILEGRKIEEDNLKTSISIIKSDAFTTDEKMLVSSTITTKEEIPEEIKKITEKLEEKRMN